MPAGAFEVYDKYDFYSRTGVIDDGDVYKAALFTSASNAGTLTNDVLATITNEVANGNGYTTGGLTLANVTVTENAGTTSFDCDDFLWTPAGGNIVADRLVIYRSGSGGGVTDPVVATCQLDTAGEITRIPGDTLSVKVSIAGSVFTVARAA